MVSGNANPVGFVDRFWEAIDVIKLALTSHDGPVSWEGKHYTHRHINIWPRPLPAAAPAILGGDRRPGDLGRDRPARLYQRAGAARARRPASARSTPTRTRGARRRCPPPAPTNSPMPCCAVSATPTRKASRSAARRCGSSTPASSRRRRCRNSCRAATRRSWRPTSGAPPAARGRPADGLIGITAEQAIARGILCRRQPRYGLPADHGDLRQGRRLRAISSLSAAPAF